MYLVQGEAFAVRRMRQRVNDLTERFTTLSANLGSAGGQLVRALACVADARERLGRARLLAEYVRLASYHPGVPQSITPQPGGASSSVNVFKGDLPTPLPPPARTGRPPEARLLSAVLEEAIESMRKNSPRANRRQRRLHGEVVAWMHSRKDESPFSFQYICTVLDLDPDYVRTGVMMRYGGQAPSADKAS